MRIIISFIILMLGIIKYYKSKSFISLNTFFHLYWGGICVLAAMRLFGIFEADIISYLMVLLGNIAFFIGSSLPRLRLISRDSYIFSNSKKTFRYDIIKVILLLIAFFIVFHKVLLMLPNIKSVGVHGARGLMATDDSVNLQGFEGILYVYFGRPFIRAFSIVSIVDLFKTKFSKSRIIIVLILNVLVYFSDGGRATIIMLFCTVVYLVLKNNIYISISTKHKIVVLSFIIVGIGVAATIERGSGVFRGLYEYFAAPMVYLGKELNNTKVFGEYTYGLNSFQGILNPIFGVLNIFGIEDPYLLQRANRFIYSVQDSVALISPSSIMNFFITCFGYFYKDFGWIGIILISIITGYIANGVEHISSRNNSLKNISIATLFFQGFIFMMSKYIFADLNFVMAIVYIHILTNDYLGNRQIKFGI